MDFEEFCALVVQFWKDFKPEDQLRDAFQSILKFGSFIFQRNLISWFYLVFDKEGNGFITQDELKKVLQSMGEVLSDEEMKEMLKDLNVNTDGTINYEGI